MQLSGLKLAAMIMVFKGRSGVFDVLILNPLCDYCSSGEADFYEEQHKISEEFTKKRGALWH